MGEKVVTMEPSKEVFLYNKDNKEVVTAKLRQTKIHALTECPDHQDHGMGVVNWRSRDSNKSR